MKTKTRYSINETMWLTLLTKDVVNSFYQSVHLATSIYLSRKFIKDWGQVDHLCSTSRPPPNTDREQPNWYKQIQYSRLTGLLAISTPPTPNSILLRCYGIISHWHKNPDKSWREVTLPSDRETLKTFVITIYSFCQAGGGRRHYERQQYSIKPVKDHGDAASGSVTELSRLMQNNYLRSQQTFSRVALHIALGSWNKPSLLTLLIIPGISWVLAYRSSTCSSSHNAP